MWRLSLFNIIFAERDFVPTQKGRNLGFFAYQRLLEKSSVTAYLEEYYEKHPLDNSYEGVLARRSGLTKENVIALLNYAEDLVFLANYNSANYNPLHTNELSIRNTKHVKISNKKVSDNFTIATIQSAFDKSYRQRNYAI